MKEKENKKRIEEEVEEDSLLRVLFHRLQLYCNLDFLRWLVIEYRYFERRKELNERYLGLLEKFGRDKKSVDSKEFNLLQCKRLLLDKEYKEWRG